jgi:hypothetical protein
MGGKKTRGCIRLASSNRMFSPETISSLQTARPISPAQHAVLDYSVATTFFGLGAYLLNRHRPAAMLAFANGAMVLGLSVLTDYPGGVFRKLSFRTHRTGDIGQALLAGLGPVLFGFAQDPEARYFYGQALSEAGVIAATDWNAA